MAVMAKAEKAEIMAQQIEDQKGNYRQRSVSSDSDTPNHYKPNKQNGGESEIQS